MAAQAGDREAFAALVDLETDRAHRLTYAVLRSAPDAEDALQDAFLRAWRDLPMLRDPDRWSAWFRRLVLTASLDRARRIRVRRLEPLGNGELQASSDVTPGLAEQEEVLQAIAQLRPEDRALIQLRYSLDLTLPDAAEALGIPLGTAKSRLHRALARLRHELGEPDGR
jgi:RNA polymerase sigma-70 factor (ECF subfamily)